MKVRRYALMVACQALVASAAWAQDHGRTTAADESRWNLETRHGASVTVGLGAMNFIGKGVRELMTRDVGFYRELRAAYGTRTRLGGELAFVLSQRSVSKERFDADLRAVFGRTFEALLRINHPMHRGRLFYAPFAVAGLGWSEFAPTDEYAATDPRTTDTVATMPVGLGMAASYRIGYVEARVMYRPTVGENGLGTAGKTSLQAWFAGVAAGVEF